MSATILQILIEELPVIECSNWKTTKIANQQDESTHFIPQTPTHAAMEMSPKAAFAIIK